MPSQDHPWFRWTDDVLNDRESLGRIGIKIDTEGFELQVLQKGNNVLRNPNLKALILETFRDYNSEKKELIAFEKILASYNFYPYFYDPLTRSIEAITKPYEGSFNTIYFRVNRENLVSLKESKPIKLFGKYYWIFDWN